MVTPKTKISYKGKEHVKLVITCKYPASKSGNTANEVWNIVLDFTNIKTIFPTIVRNYVTYPDTTQKKIGTIRDMTFGGKTLSIGIEKLTKISEKKRTLAYTSLDGLPVTNYLGVMSVKGSNACTLTWTITYDQSPIDKKFAKFLTGLFVKGEIEIAKVIGLK